MHTLVVGLNNRIVVKFTVDWRKDEVIGCCFRHKDNFFDTVELTVNNFSPNLLVFPHKTSTL